MSAISSRRSNLPPLDSPTLASPPTHVPTSLPFLDPGWSLEFGADEARARGVLSANDEIYEGHFAGRPILPAVAQLELARATLSIATGGRLALRRVPALKLRNTLTPEMPVELQLGAEGEGGARRFALLSDDGPISSGSLAFVPAAADPLVLPDLGDASTRKGDFARPESLLPHEPPACLITSITSLGDGSIVCAGRIPRCHPLVVEGIAPSFLGLEAGAQASGLLEALEHRSAEGPAARVGYIVGVREAILDPASVPAGRPFRVFAQRSGGAGALAIYAIEAGVEGRPFARGTLSAYIPEPGQG